MKIERLQKTILKYKDRKRLLSATICQQLGRNRQILRKVELSKTEPGRTRKS